MDQYQDFLASTRYIDWQTPEVAHQAKHLAADSDDPYEIAQRCFEFVRDEISHSMDRPTTLVTLSASEVLQHKTGFCYAKSHLLAALLRANQIPAGLCYQRLCIDDDGGDEMCLHSLNAVRLPDSGWYRIDARGNKPGVDARFSPPQEQLAFPLKNQGETDLPEIWPEPLPVVISAMQKASSVDELAAHLPDVELMSVSAR